MITIKTKMEDETIDREIIPIRSMSEPEVDKHGRTQAEKDEIKNIIKGLSEEECKDVIRLIPDEVMWEELFRRNTRMLQRINQIEEVVGVSMDNILPIPIDTWNEIKRRYLDLKNKYMRIRKLGGN